MTKLGFKGLIYQTVTDSSVVHAVHRRQKQVRSTSTVLQGTVMCLQHY